MTSPVRSPELALRICTEIAEGKSLRTICKQDDMPGMTWVFAWLGDDAEFAKQYARARDAQADALVEEMLEIAHDGTNDWMEVEGRDGSTGWKLNGEHVQRSRLRVDTLKWYASKLKPKKYGEKVEVEHSGEVKVEKVERVIVDPKKAA